MKDIPLWENEQILADSTIGQPGRFSNGMGGLAGKIIVTNLRIVCHFPKLGVFYEMPHKMITSFKWDSGFLKGGHFKITWFYNKQSHQVHYQANNKRRIAKVLEKMPYYDKPAVLKQWPGQSDEPVL